jgi:hypothetical protein
MKTSKVIPVVVAALLTMGSAATVFAGPSTGWPNNKGEVCLQVLEGVEVVGTVQMYVTQMGDGHYLVLGRNIEETEVIPFIGAAELVENKTMVRMHGTASGVMQPTSSTDPGDVHGSLVTMILDRGSLVGTLEGLDINSALDNSEFHVEYSGMKNIRPCGQ